MNVTDEETKRFLKLIDPTYRSDMRDILSNMHAMHAPIVFVRMLNTGDDTFSYHGNYILVIGEDTAFNSKVIVFDQTFAKFKEDNAEFITSYISRRFNNLKLIFSSSVTRIFAENISAINLAISCLDDGVFIAKLFSNNNAALAFELSENNADFSNEIWDIALSDRSNVNHMMSAYISGKYYVSDNIKKRIQALYESLSESDKLLLELGEDI